MPDEILQKTIKIAGAEETESQIKIRDENKKTYSFFKNKKDGNPTKAFDQWEQYKIGDETGISYKEVPYKDGTIRNILGFTPAGIQEVRPQAQKQTPQPIKQAYHKEEEKDDEFWNKKAVGKCQTLFLQALIQSGKSISDAKLQVIPARQLAELVVYGVQQEEEQVDVDSIPF